MRPHLLHCDECGATFPAERAKVYSSGVYDPWGRPEKVYHCPWCGADGLCSSERDGYDWDDEWTREWCDMNGIDPDDGIAYEYRDSFYEE